MDALIAALSRGNDAGCTALRFSGCERRLDALAYILQVLVGIGDVEMDGLKIVRAKLTNGEEFR